MGFPRQEYWGGLPFHSPGDLPGVKPDFLVALAFAGSFFPTEPPSVHFSSVAQSCLILWDPMNGSTPGLPVHHQLPEFTQTRVH